MGLFTIKGRSDSAHRPPYEKPRKRKLLEKKNREDSKAVSVNISYSGEQKFKHYLSLRRNLEQEVYSFQIMDSDFTQEQKDFLFERYMELYGRPIVFREDVFPLLDLFISNVFTQAKTYFHTQTDHLTQEHLKLI